MKRTMGWIALALSLTATGVADGGPAARWTLTPVEEVAIPTAAPGGEGVLADAKALPGSVDYTAETKLRWQVSEFNAANLGGHGAGNHALWCGAYFAGDPGYGNLWDSEVRWDNYLYVPPEGVDVVVRAQLNFDLEADYDWLYLQVRDDGTWTNLLALSGTAADLSVDTWPHHLDPGDVWSETPGDGRLLLRWLVVTDGSISDEDGALDTDGACQIDDVEVLVDDARIDFADFESASAWTEYLDPGVGDYAKLWSWPGDIDPCVTENQAICFVDDGSVVPGTGGTPAVTWAYFAGGYVVNCEGGLLGTGHYLDNGVLTPPITWNPADRAAVLSLDAYAHEELTADSPGIFYQWQVRSTTSTDEADLEAAPWRDDNALYYGGPAWYHHSAHVGHLLEPGCRLVQAQFRVRQLGHIYGFDGTDATPAPYLAHLRIDPVTSTGPSVRPVADSQPGDRFPAQGYLDDFVPQTNWCRFETARDGADGDPEDAILFRITPLADGFALSGFPTMEIVVAPDEHVFDQGMRTLPAGFTRDADGHYVGTLTGIPTGGTDEFGFTMTADHFLYPGDVLHYRVTATTSNGSTTRTTVWPGTDGDIADFGPRTVYPREATVYYLPSLQGTLDQPPAILVWNDTTTPLGAAWVTALRLLGLEVGRDLDIYWTRNADGDKGNGLGNRIPQDVLDGYDLLLYDGGHGRYNTLTAPENLDGVVSDLDRLDTWLDGDFKCLMVSGARVTQDLARSATGQAFLQSRLGVERMGSCTDCEVSGSIWTEAVASSVTPMFPSGGSWSVLSGCGPYHPFDLVRPLAGTFRTAEYRDWAGQLGTFDYAAATWRPFANGSDAMFFPYDLDWVARSGTNPGEPQGLTVLSMIIDGVLNTCGMNAGFPSDVPAPAVLGLDVYPNPFNPRTTFWLDLPEAREVVLEIFDARGRRVRTVHRGPLPAGMHDLVWSGRDEHDRKVAAGVYFYRLDAGADQRRGKLALVK